MNFWIYLYRLAPSRGLRQYALQRAFELQIRTLENSYGKPVRYHLRSSTLDVHKLLVQHGWITYAIELLNLAINVAPQAKNLTDAKRSMLMTHGDKTLASTNPDDEELQYAWDSLYLTSLLRESTRSR
jgi:hypothetical protein